MIKVISWNILAIEFVKKSHYPHIYIDSIKDRKNRIKKITFKLLEEDADIILLQEVMSLEYNYIKKYFKNYIFSDLYKCDWKDYKKSESGNIILFKKTSFSQKFVNQELIYNNRVFGLYINLNIKGSKESLKVFNVHLDDSFFQTRNAQIKTIRNLLNDTKYCILGGDFNQVYNKNSKIYNIKNFIVQNTVDITYYIGKHVNIDNILTKGFVKSDVDSNCDYKTFSQQKLFDLFGSDHLPIQKTLYILHKSNK